ncbi:MAG: alpha-mannosidase [Armatimonadota bacterium]
MNEQKLNSIIQTIDTKLASFRAVYQLNDWYFRIGDTPDALSENINPDNWQVVPVFFNWTASEGKAWLRRDINLPDQVNGVSLEGAKVDFVFLVPIGTTLYIDGEVVYSAPYWADSVCIPIEVTPSFVPGKKHTISMQANDGDGYGFLVIAQLSIERLNKECFDLELIKEQLNFTRFLIDTRSESKDRDMEEYARAVDALDIDALMENRWADWRESAKKAVDTLMFLNDDAKSFEVKLASHAHIDMNWLWPWSETVDLCYRDFSTMDKLMDRYPDFCFSQSQAATYKAVEDHYPELFERIKERVKEGRWDITASTWVEADLNMALGETISRHLLHTRKYIGDKFGIRPKICWEPDTFGHNANMPQILAKSDVEYYYHCRSGKGVPIFWWESPDGSKVLVFSDFTGYGGEIWPTSIMWSALNFEKTTGLSTSLWIYGAGDHGGGTTAADIDRGIAINNAPLMPRMVMSTTADFYDMLKESGADFPVIRGEMNPVLEGCYTSHADIKKLNRAGENDLLTAETLAALTSICGDINYPIDTFTDAWTNQEFHQFHDILCGCSIGSTYKEAADTLGKTQNKIKNFTAESVSRLTSHVNTGEGSGRKIVVYNQLAYDRTDIVKVSPDGTGIDMNEIAQYSIMDDKGSISPIQMLDGMIAFAAKDVPALGCRVYEIIQGTEQAKGTLKVDEENRMVENEFLRARIHPESGAFDLLELIEHGKVYTIQDRWGEFTPNDGTLNLFSLYYERPHRMSAWVIGSISKIETLLSGAEVRLVENGPVCVAFEVRHKFLNSSLKQQIRFYSGIDRVDFVTEVDWHEKGSSTTDAPMLKAVFSPKLGRSKAFYEIPYGAVERVADGNEVPALRWADISDDEFGITLYNDSKYGYHAQGNTLALTLLRSSYQPDANPDEGLHKFTYSIHPHKGTWVESDAINKGAGFNQPMIGVIESSHDGDIIPGKPYIQCSQDNIVISAVKPAEDQLSDGSMAIIVRLFEAYGKQTIVEISTGWNISDAYECNMIEEVTHPIDVKDNSLILNFSTNEIKTLRLIVK